MFLYGNWAIGQFELFLRWNWAMVYFLLQPIFSVDFLTFFWILVICFCVETELLVNLNCFCVKTEPLVNLNCFCVEVAVLNLLLCFISRFHHVETFTGKVFWFVLKFYRLNRI